MAVCIQGFADAPWRIEFFSLFLEGKRPFNPNGGIVFSPKRKCLPRTPMLLYGNVVSVADLFCFVAFPVLLLLFLQKHSCAGFRS